ncbi:SulP family inorganic anion transporter [Gordonia sp. HY002]|uniref:SulP family inorganic anion transporter n=1 Tax=Gordonia zhenghanii TaxID=2911516 RepID=UPI001EEF9796|nr:SulP family inorganic anion transporter [Gordonia zhenghanii]MCF8571044.1 SulP family inorganic anion transporter [Gordonia zhenghanii]MCF8606388.1 SulP family inorganic anion transporter [Gordonia zhenghanii]
MSTRRLTGTLRGYRVVPGLNKQNVAREAMAGITLVTIAIPLNIGYAQIAGLPPIAGLYALIIPTILYAIVISSRQLVASPDAAAAALVASSIGGLAVAGTDDYAALAMAQAIICGLVLLLMSVFRLGFLANFLSEPILTGFVGGLALDILVSQTAKMLGVHLDSGEEFVGKLVGLVTGLPDANGWSVVIAAASLVVLLSWRVRLPRVPWALIVLVGATVVVATVHLDEHGVSVLGEVQGGPPIFTWPSLSIAQWLAVVPSAIALAMVTTVEGLLVSRSYAEKHGYTVSPDRDLAAFGVGNVAAGFTGSFSVGSSTSRTAAMDDAGSRTQLPSFVLAVATFFLLLFGTGLLTSIPSPAIGAIVAVAVVPLLGIEKFIRMWSLDRFEFSIAAVCFATTIFVGSIAGIFVAFVLALVNIARRASNPAIDVLHADGAGSGRHKRLTAADKTVTAPGLIVLRPAAPLFFANADVVVQAAKDSVSAAETPVKHLVIDMEAVTDVDVTASDALERLRTWLADNDITLGFSRLREAITPRLRTLGVLGESDRVFSTNREAAAELRIDE